MENHTFPYHYGTHFTELRLSRAPRLDQYDLLVVDECHRSYLLDREMSDAELTFRSQDDYISKYRRVLEHFDAVKIGLTATPALHTVTISALCGLRSDRYPPTGSKLIRK